MTYKCESCNQIFNSSEQLAYYQIQEHASKTDLTSNIDADQRTNNINAVREENERQQLEEEQQPNAITLGLIMKTQS